MKVPDFDIGRDPRTYAQLDHTIVNGGYSPYRLDRAQISTNNLAQAHQIKLLEVWRLRKG